LRRLRTLLVALLALAVVAPFAPVGAQTHTKTDETVLGAGDTPIRISVFRPAGAGADNPVPVILHSHGWGGSRNSSAGAFTREMDRGYAVVSIDQRGFGQSGGKANVTDPDLEGEDIIAVIDHLAALDWIAKDDGPGGTDPVLFAIGGSYGGGYQLVAALQEVRKTGSTRFNAIAPDMTWFNLSRSLAPEGVVRSAWGSLLFAAGARNLVEYVHPAFAYGLSTGQWPDGTVPGIHDLDEEFYTHGPSVFVEREGLQLDIPALITQGASDNLFNLNEGIHNFERTLSDGARARSAFVGYNGGHALPNVAPMGFANGSNACTRSSGIVQLDFFDAVRADGGARDVEGLETPYSFTDAYGTCVRADSLGEVTAATGHDLQVTTGMATTTGVGAPQQLPLAQGPITVTGIPELHATVTTAGADQRVFFGLSVGTNPLDARIVQNNMMPLRELLPIVATERTVELPGVAIEVPEGQTLYLTVSPVSDMSFGHGSVRTPGAVTLQGITVDLPVPLAAAEVPVEDGPGDEPAPGDEGASHPGQGATGNGQEREKKANPGKGLGATR
jgi:pimeloyl-ACP methyl ester carboxylesterase